MKLWMVCWHYPVVSEVIVVTEFEELLRQGVDGLLVPLHEIREPATSGNFSIERVMRPAELPSNRLGQLGLALNVAIRNPWRFLLCLRRVLSYVGDDARGALKTFLQIVSANAKPFNPEHIHAHFGGHLAHVASLMAIYYGCRWSTTVHAKDIYMRPKRLAVDFRDASFVRTISQHGQDWVLRYCPNLEQSRVLLIHCGVDTQKIQVVRTNGVARKEFRLLSVGRLVAKKGHDILIEACALLRDKGFAIKCEIIGEGPERQRLEGLITKKSLSSIVILLGALPRSDVLEHLAQSDAMVLASRESSDGDREGIPLVLMEAMAMGKPVIAGQVGGVGELVTRGGIVITNISAHGLASAIEGLVTMPAVERRKLGQFGRTRVEEAFSLQKNMLELYGWFESNRTAIA